MILRLFVSPKPKSRVKFPVPKLKDIKSQVLRSNGQVRSSLVNKLTDQKVIVLNMILKCSILLK